MEDLLVDITLNYSDIPVVLGFTDKTTVASEGLNSSLRFPACIYRAYT